MSKPTSMSSLLIAAVALVVLSLGLWIMARPAQEPPRFPPAPPKASLAPVQASTAKPSSPQAAKAEAPDEVVADAGQRADIPQDTGPAQALAPDAGSTPDAAPDKASDLASDLAAPQAQVPDAGAEPATPQDKPSGTVSKEEILGSIKLMKPKVKTCYESLLKDFPQADGRIVLRFTLVGQGDTSLIDLEKIKDTSSLYDKQMNQCMLDALRGVEMPPIDQGKEVSVSFPFTFASKDQPEDP